MLRAYMTRVCSGNRDGVELHTFESPDALLDWLRAQPDGSIDAVRVYDDTEPIASAP